MKDWDNRLSLATTSSGKPFLGNGLRSYGSISIFGYEQALEVTKNESDWLDEEVLIFGELMDGSFIGLYEGRVVFINPMEPEYEKDWRMSSVMSSLTLPEFNNALENNPCLLPNDYCQACKCYGL